MDGQKPIPKVFEVGIPLVMSLDELRLFMAEVEKSGNRSKYLIMVRFYSEEPWKQKWLLQVVINAEQDVAVLGGELSRFAQFAFYGAAMTKP